ncbi:MAG: hypothetical protein LCH38_07260 [Proteobacteria bacterium]|nr:hypothetical protein [Pseudomonadota bacterium]
MASQSARKRSPAQPGRAQLVKRLWRTAEKQVETIEARMAAMAGEPAGLEREAKILAVIARTLRDLVALDVEARAAGIGGKRKQGNSAGGEQEDGGYSGAARDLSAFREELARRLDQLRAGGAGGNPDPQSWADGS